MADILVTGDNGTQAIVRTATPVQFVVPVAAPVEFVVSGALQGVQGPKGDKGDTGAQGIQGVQGIKGDKGDTGNPGVVQSVVAGTNMTVDSTDPAHPIVNATAQPLIIKDEGSTLTSHPNSLNFVGAGVTATVDGANNVTVDVEATPPPDASSTVKGLIQLAGDLGGTAASPTVPGLASKANDAAVVHTTGNETVGGTKTFSSAPVVPANSFPESAVTNLSTDLAAKAADSAVVHNSGNETVAGVKTFSSSPVVPTPTTSTQVANKSYVDGFGTISLVRNEAPGGTVNGSNVNFTTASTFATGSLKVFLNGQRLTPGAAADYTEVTRGFTMNYAPATGDVLLVDYELTNSYFAVGSNSIIVGEVPTGSVNGTNTSFTVLQAKYVANTLKVMVNGLVQARGTDYTETTPASGVFTMTTAPQTGDVITADYQFSTGASGNADTVDGIHAATTPTANKLAPLGSDGKVQSAAMPGAKTYAVGTTSVSIATTDTAAHAVATITIPAADVPTGHSYCIMATGVGSYNHNGTTGGGQAYARINVNSGGVVAKEAITGVAAGNYFVGPLTSNMACSLTAGVANTVALEMYKDFTSGASANVGAWGELSVLMIVV